MPAHIAASAYRSGICVWGTTNIKYPVVIPNGGIRIFFVVTGLAEARSRKKITNRAMQTAPIVVTICKFTDAGNVKLQPPQKTFFPSNHIRRFLAKWQTKKSGLSPDRLKVVVTPPGFRKSSGMTVIAVFLTMENSSKRYRFYDENGHTIHEIAF